ncbi:MAG: hypothetical protein LBJ95_05315 [Oscillospiraceae bacterium]|nr:hypothetical protein [Oscillospiraceae bacterium]
MMGQIPGTRVRLKVCPILRLAGDMELGDGRVSIPSHPFGSGLAYFPNSADTRARLLG